MKFEEYVNEKNSKTYIKLGRIGVLKDRTKVVKGSFLSFEGEPDFGWWKLKVDGVEGVVRVSDAWIKMQDPPLIEGEELEILLDKIDGVAWKIARNFVGSEATVQTEQSGLQEPAVKTDTPKSTVETKDNFQLM